MSGIGALDEPVSSPSSACVSCRAYVVGLSDEAGAGANVGLAAKAQHAPAALEVARVDEYIHNTLFWGVKQDIPFNISLQDHATMGIRASLFWVPTPVSASAFQLHSLGTDGRAIVAAQQPPSSM